MVYLKLVEKFLLSSTLWTRGASVNGLDSRPEIIWFVTPFPTPSRGWRLLSRQLSLLTFLFRIFFPPIFILPLYDFPFPVQGILPMKFFLTRNFCKKEIFVYQLSKLLAAIYTTCSSVVSFSLTFPILFPFYVNYM
jgi:hypothetical protein